MVCDNFNLVIVDEFVFLIKLIYCYFGIGEMRISFLKIYFKWNILCGEVRSVDFESRSCVCGVCVVCGIFGCDFGDFLIRFL